MTRFTVAVPYFLTVTLLVASGCSTTTGALTEGTPSSFEMESAIEHVRRSISSPDEAVARLKNRLAFKRSLAGIDNYYQCNSLDGRTVSINAGRLLDAATAEFRVNCYGVDMTRVRHIEYDYSETHSYTESEIWMKFQKTAVLSFDTSASIHVGGGRFVVKDKETALEVYGLLKYLYDRNRPSKPKIIQPQASSRGVSTTPKSSSDFSRQPSSEHLANSDQIICQRVKRPGHWEERPGHIGQPVKAWVDGEEVIDCSK